MKEEQKERIQEWVRTNDTINHEIIKSCAKYIMQALITKDPVIESISDACKRFDEHAMRTAIQIQSTIAYKLWSRSDAGIEYTMDLISLMNKEDKLMEFIDELKADKAISNIVNDYLDTHLD
jgi:hypothetical protein|nr:MAG TPA: hypothetical protein [Caudoviricetes sp.]